MKQLRQNRKWTQFDVDPFFWRTWVDAREQKVAEYMRKNSNMPILDGKSLLKKSWNGWGFPQAGKATLRAGIDVPPAGRTVP